MKIMITNDDGINAPGLQVLAGEAARAGHEVYICAPVSQRSAASHSITLNQPLIAEEMHFPGIAGAYAVYGTPADCTSLGLTSLFPQAEAVLSGINHGYNGGIDVLYSGTVSAAMEGALLGVPAIAVSLAMEREDTYDRAAALALRLLEEIRQNPLPPMSILNVNYPAVDKAKGLRVTGTRPMKYHNFFTPEVLPDGRTAYRLDGYMESIEEPGDDDYSWLYQGYATVSVFSYDRTDRQATGRLSSLQEKVLLG